METTSPKQVVEQIVPDNSLLDRMAVFLSSQLDAQSQKLFQEWKALKAKNPVTRKQLAEQARKADVAAQKYYGHKTTANLEAAKLEETILRRMVSEVLDAPKPKQTDLFTNN